MIRDRKLIGQINLRREAGPVIAWISLALLLPLAAAGCGHKGEAAGTSESQSQGVEVSVANPQRKDLTRPIDQPGHLKPYEQTPIYTKIAGIAKEPKCDIGDRLKKGDLLVELYVPEVVQELHLREARVTQAKADLEQSKEAAGAAKAGWDAALSDINAKLASIESAKAQVERWEKEVDRANKLLKESVFDRQTRDEQVNQLHASRAVCDEMKAKWISSQATAIQTKAIFNKCEADILVARANLEVSKASLEWQRDWLAYAKITAPYDGVVTLRNVHSGWFLAASVTGSTNKAADPLFVMMRTDIMRCTVDVPELDSLLVKVGDKAIVRFQAMPGTESIGTVTRFSEALDDKSRTLRVELHLPNPENKLLPGLYANVTILAKIRNAWTIPPEAKMDDILADGDKPYCFMVEDGKARKMFLQLGTTCEEGLQVLRKQRPGSTLWENLSGHEAVVVSKNCKGLEDGQAVKIKVPETR